MTELCTAYGISRPTGYKWLRRAGAGESLADRSRRPRSCPHRTPAELEAAIVRERRRHPHWGPDKILAVLRRQRPEVAWPSSSTAGEILRRHELVLPRRKRRKRTPAGVGRFEPDRPNAVWSSDFKGEFRVGTGAYCYPLTVADGCSRFLLGCQGLASTAHEPAKAVFERLFACYGLPEAILTDNGGPFASPALGGLSRLSVWWIRLGIVPLRIEKGQPQQNGRHERMHRTLKAETARPPGADLAAQQARFDAFRREYNHERPHAALDQRMPAEGYVPSPRALPAKLPDLAYPGHLERRRVRGNGCIKWRGRERFLSEVLAGEWVALEELDEGVWSLRFGPLELGRFDDRRERFERSEAVRYGASPLALRARCEAPHREHEDQEV